MKKHSASYEERYKHKLNMLGPGSVMMKCAGALAAVGAACLIFGWNTAAYAVLGLAGLILLVLFVLLGIESHQDKVLNELAARENRDEWRYRP